jgi:hypothetical protein
MDDEFSDADDHETEAQSIYNSLRSLVNSLFKLSTIIRRPAQHDRIINSRRNDSLHFEQYDRAHVMEKYPHADPIIISRLGAAISRRRRDLKYRERHHQKLSQGLDILSSGRADDRTVALSSTVATEFQVSRVGIDDAASDTNMTQTSIAPSLFDPQKGNAIPSPPKDSEQGGFFQCPYCYIIISIKDRKDWARHVFLDILPYICLYSACESATRLFGLQREWIGHIEEIHGGSAFDETTSVECPLCNENVWKMTEHRLRRHLARHMEDLALFAIPRGEDDVTLVDQEEPDAETDSVLQTPAEEFDMGNDTRASETHVDPPQGPVGGPSDWPLGIPIPIAPEVAVPVQNPRISPTDPRDQWEIDAETAKVRRAAIEEEKTRKRAEEAEQEQIKKTMKQEEYTTRRRQSEIDRAILDDPDLLVEVLEDLSSDASDDNEIGPEARRVGSRGPVPPDPVEEEGPDVVILSFGGQYHKLHFVPYAVSDGLLLVGDLRKYAAEKIMAQDPSEVKLLYKGMILDDDRVAAKDCGVKHNSAIECSLS